MLRITLSDVVDVQFASDPATISLPPGATHLTDFVENGDFQSLFTENAYNFQVRSDVGETPAPATLFLLGSGLAGLGALGWRRRRG